MEFMQCNQTYTNISHSCQLWPGSKGVQPMTREQIKKYTSLVLHYYSCNRLLSQPPASTLLLFQPMSSAKLSVNAAAGVTVLKWKSDHVTSPFKTLQCHFIVWDYLASAWVTFPLSHFAPAIASSQPKLFLGVDLSPRNFTPVSLCTCPYSGGGSSDTSPPRTLSTKISPSILHQRTLIAFFIATVSVACL